MIWFSRGKNCYFCDITFFFLRPWSFVRTVEIRQFVLVMVLKDRQQSLEQIEQWALISVIYSLRLNCISNDFVLIESKLIKDYDNRNKMKIIRVLEKLQLYKTLFLNRDILLNMSSPHLKFGILIRYIMIEGMCLNFIL